MDEAVTNEPIAEVGFDGLGRLFVRPSQTKFRDIYRAAMEVHWDENVQVLHSPEPERALSALRKWTWADWYRQIIGAAADEYGIRLTLGTNTRWLNIAPDLRKQIVAISSNDGSGGGT